MKRKHKTYSKPKRPFDKARIDEEALIKTEYGLKNKKELWKADAKINSIREKAKKLIPASEADQKEFFIRLNKIGLKVDSIADVLSLDKKSYLDRRLQTILVKKKLAKTTKEARQLITHKKVLVYKGVVNAPSYVVPIDLEDKIQLKKKVAKKKVKEEPVIEKTEEPKVEETKSEEPDAQSKPEENKPEENK